jgi:AAA15 family ATPase/GTPase
MSAYEERASELRVAEQHAGVLEALRTRAQTTQPTILFRQGRLGATLRAEDQSTGTRRWLSLVAQALSTLDDGGLLAVDEADTGVHPRLTARLIDLFRDPGSNRRGAQLLFTTHHGRLRDDDLAGDEVWLVDKDPDTGETRLFPQVPRLTVVRPRNHVSERTSRRRARTDQQEAP